MFGLKKESAEEKEAKKQAKLKQNMEEFKDRYNLSEISEDDFKAILNISRSLSGNDLIQLGMALSFDKAEEQAKVSSLSALIEQNWIIINMLNRINNNLEKLTNK